MDIDRAMTGLTRFSGRRRYHSRFGRPGRLAELITLWYLRWEQRGALATLDKHLLRDIGKSQGQALDEASKPFWQP